MIIDVHAHAFPAKYMSKISQLGIAPQQMPGGGKGIKLRPLSPAMDGDEDVAGRIALMDEAGVKRQILSPTIAPYFNSHSDGVMAARILNDSFATMTTKNSNRLAAFVSLPLPHLDASLAEMAWGLDELGMIGVTMHCFCQDCSVADARFEPLYEEMNRRSAVLFMHPCVNGLCSPFITDWQLTESAGPTIEDAVIAMHFMVRSIPHRYPKIKIIIPHLGGGLATQLARLDNQLPHYADLAESPSVTAKRFWYDTVAHGSTTALRCAVDSFGADKIVPGSDYPILTIHEAYKDTFEYVREASLPDGVSEQILTKNAPLLFGQN